MAGAVHTHQPLDAHYGVVNIGVGRLKVDAGRFALPLFPSFFVAHEFVFRGRDYDLQLGLSPLP